MKRRGKIALFTVGLGMAAGAAALAIYRTDDAKIRNVPVHVVTEGSFSRIVNAEGVLRPVKTTTLKAPSGRDALMIAWMVSDGDPVKKGDVIIKFDSGELTRKLADRAGERFAADGMIAKEKTLTAAAMRERERVAALTRDELERSRDLGIKDERFFPKTEVIQSQIDENLFERRLDQAIAARKHEEKRARSQIDLLIIERRLADIEYEEVRGKLRALEIRAPHDGTFLLQRPDGRGVTRAGDRIPPSMKIAEVSSNDDLIAEVFVLEADAGGLAANKPATVYLEARPDQPLTARVKRVSAFPKPEYPDNPTQYFSTMLELDQSAAGLKPGQRLHATIFIEEIPKAMAVPRQAVFRAEAGTVVYRRAGGGFEPTKVTIGAGTVGRLVITQGVKPGDELALRDPTLSINEAATSTDTRNKK